MHVGMPAVVESARYVAVDVPGAAQPQSAIRFHLAESPFEQQYVDVPNGGWSKRNAALCVLAALGGRPTDLDAVEGSLLPVTADSAGWPIVTDATVGRGQTVLDEADWFVEGGPDTTTVDGAVAQASSGGGGSDPTA